MTAVPATAPVRLIPHGELADMLKSVMHRREYMAEEPYLVHVDGEWRSRALPPDKGLRLSDFLAAIAELSDPAPAPDVITAIVTVIRHRGYAFLLDELDAEWEARWPDPAADNPAAALGYALKCQWCSGAIPAARGPKARYCKNSHRVSSHRAKKRAADKAAAAANATAGSDR